MTGIRAYPLVEMPRDLPNWGVSGEPITICQKPSSLYLHRHPFLFLKVWRLALFNRGVISKPDISFVLSVFFCFLFENELSYSLLVSLCANQLLELYHRVLYSPRNHSSDMPCKSLLCAKTKHQFQPSTSHPPLFGVLYNSRRAILWYYATLQSQELRDLQPLFSFSG